MVEEIKSKKGDIIAIIIKHDVDPEGVVFYTPSAFSQQLGLLKHKKGSKIRAHMHLVRAREVKYTQEVLHIKKGKIKVYLYDDERKHIGTRTLHEGDTILLAFGGHGIEVVEDSLILEVKQGPYTDPSEKEFFE